MKKYVTRISAVEVPVSNLEASIDWYITMLGLEVQHKDAKSAMLTFNAIGVPGVFLCKTESNERLQFLNTNTDTNHSVVDFYASDLEGYHHFFCLNKGLRSGS